MLKRLRGGVCFTLRRHLRHQSDIAEPRRRETPDQPREIRQAGGLAGDVRTGAAIDDDVAGEAGAEDVVTHDDGVIEVLTATADFEAVKNALQAAGLVAEEATITMRAQNTIELEGEDAVRMQKLLDVLEDLDDVQDIFHNAAI